MLLPYLTRCYRAVVRHAPDPEPEPERRREVFETTGVEEAEPPEPPEPPEEPGTLLIDFR
jgi:hypothetical protein